MYLPQKRTVQGSLGSCIRCGWRPVPKVLIFLEPMLVYLLLVLLSPLARTTTTSPDKVRASMPAQLLQ